MSFIQTCCCSVSTQTRWVICFTVCWCCYLNLQLQLGLFRPRKIGSTFETNIFTKTRTHSFCHAYAHIPFVAFLEPFRVLHSLQRPKIYSWLRSHCATPGGAKSNLLTFPTGSASCNWKDPFSDKVNCVTSCLYKSFIRAFYHYVVIYDLIRQNTNFCGYNTLRVRYWFCCFKTRFWKYKNNKYQEWFWSGLFRWFDIFYLSSSD